MSSGSYVAVGQKENPQKKHRFWSIFPFTSRVLGYPFLTHVALGGENLGICFTVFSGFCDLDKCLFFCGLDTVVVFSN